MQTKKYLIKFWGQSHLLGVWWGNLQTIAQHTNIYIQFLILSFSATSAYSVLSSTLHQWGYQLPFWLFVVLVVVSIILLSLFVWRLSIPSTFATWNDQWWHHGNFLKPIVEKQTNEIAELKKELLEIKGLLINANQRTSKVSTEKD